METVEARKCLACSSILPDKKFYYCNFCRTYGKTTGKQIHQREVVRARNKVYYQKTKKERIAKVREWQKNNPEYRKQYYRDYAKKHRAEINRNSRKYKTKKREEANYIDWLNGD